MVAGRKGEESNRRMCGGVEKKEGGRREDERRGLGRKIGREVRRWR